jgi:putative endonuclease
LCVYSRRRRDLHVRRQRIFRIVTGGQRTGRCFAALCNTHFGRVLPTGFFPIENYLLNLTMRFHNFFCYITANPTKTVIYVGACNDLPLRLTKHYSNRGQLKTFAGRYNFYNLIYFEQYQFVNDAFARELQIKGWSRNKKITLIESENPEWKFLNSEIMDWPPPVDAYVRG